MITRFCHEFKTKSFHVSKRTNRGRKRMGYALFAQRKLVLDSQLNSAQLQQTQRSNEQYALANNKLGLQRQLSALQVSQATQLADLYKQLAEAPDSSARSDIEGRIAVMEADHKLEQENINNQIYAVGIKENAIEMEVKALDTEVTALQKQLEAVEEAEGKAIDRATPKFNGVG